jgi:hypothetical protein
MKESQRMTPDSNRRRWDRLGLEGAVALDESGRELGHVVEVSGGGIGVKLNPDRRFEDWADGKRLRLTVQESGAAHTVVCRVRYVHSGILGLEFAS